MSQLGSEWTRTDRARIEQERTFARLLPLLDEAQKDLRLVVEHEACADALEHELWSVWHVLTRAAEELEFRDGDATRSHALLEARDSFLPDGRGLDAGRGSRTPLAKSADWTVEPTLDALFKTQPLWDHAARWEAAKTARSALASGAAGVPAKNVAMRRWSTVADRFLRAASLLPKGSAVRQRVESSFERARAEARRRGVPAGAGGWVRAIVRRNVQILFALIGVWLAFAFALAQQRHLFHNAFVELVDSVEKLTPVIFGVLVYLGAGSLNDDVRGMLRRLFGGAIGTTLILGAGFFAGGVLILQSLRLVHCVVNCAPGSASTTVIVGTEHYAGCSEPIYARPGVTVHGEAPGFWHTPIVRVPANLQDANGDAPVTLEWRVQQDWDFDADRASALRDSIAFPECGNHPAWLVPIRVHLRGNVAFPATLGLALRTENAHWARNGHTQFVAPDGAACHLSPNGSQVVLDSSCVDPLSKPGEARAQVLVCSPTLDKAPALTDVVHLTLQAADARQPTEIFLAPADQ